MRHPKSIAIAALVLIVGPLAPPALTAEPKSVLQNAPLPPEMLVSEAELGAQRGRYKPEAVHFSSQELDAVLEDNNAIGTANGDNTVANQAFTNAQGHLSVIQNSGNNVIIQDTTIYNITFID